MTRKPSRKTNTTTANEYSEFSWTRANIRVHSTWSASVHTPDSPESTRMTLATDGVRGESERRGGALSGADPRGVAEPMRYAARPTARLPATAQP